MRKFAAYAAGAAMAVLASLPGAADARTITDVLDRKVDVPDRVDRVLLGFYFEDFYAIAGPKAYDRVVAISKGAWHGWRNLQWQAYEKTTPRINKLTDVGEVYAGTFSIETAIAARPDVAIIAEWQFTGMGDAVDKLQAAGIPVVVADYNAQTVEKHVKSTLMIGDVMGTPDRAKELADLYASAVADVQKRVRAAGGTAKRVYVELGNKSADTYGNSYTNHMWGAAIGLAGGRNIALGQIAKWAPLNPEYVLATDPEVVFIAGSGWVGRNQAVLMGPGVDPATTHDRLRPYLARPGWTDMTAVKNRQVHAVYHGGARTLYDFTFLQYIAKTLYPDAFRDVDPDANLKAFFRKYLPIRAEGTYWTRMPKP